MRKLFLVLLLALWLAPVAEAQAKSVRGARAFVTCADKREIETDEPLTWHDAKGPEKRGFPRGDEIEIVSDKKCQEILGFGAAFTDASCYVLNGMPKDERKKLFRLLFHPDEMGLNVCRTCIGASDYATHLYSYDEGEPDPDMKRFSIDFDKKYILPMLREARDVNPDIFLFSSPWSPPGWMKSTGSMLGGNMQRRSLKPYAKYFVKFLQEYQSNGVPVQAVTVQNEVDTDQDARMPACVWPQELEVDFVRYELGPALKEAGLKTQIWIIDHNYHLWGRALGSLDSTDFRKYCNAIAWHGYGGDAVRMSTVHDAYPDVDMYWTEGGPDYTDKGYATDWTKWSKTFTGILRNWCRSITAWNFALDENGKPNIGPFPCGGLVTVNSANKSVSFSGQFWALSHYSRYVKRGARRLESKGELASVCHVAFENPDGQRVAVLTNEGDKEHTVVVRDGDKWSGVTLPADSVTTLLWK